MWGSKICLICWYSVIHVPMKTDPMSEWVWSRIVPFWASRSRVVVEHIILFFFRKKLTFRSGRQCSRKSVQCPVWCGDPRGRCQSGYHLMKTFSIVGKHLWICIITRDQLWPKCSVAFAYELIAERNNIHIFLTGFNFIKSQSSFVFLSKIDFQLRWTTGLRKSMSIL